MGALFEIEGDGIDKAIKLRLAKSLTSEKRFNFKERFDGIPKSVMSFNKSPELMDLIDGDKSELNDVTKGKAKKRGGGYAKNMKYSTYNPDQAYFILDYYTKQDDLILDPFMGRGTRPLITTLLKRAYVGYDTCEDTVNYNRELLDGKFPDNNQELILGDGTSIGHIKDRVIDAVFSCPPYYDKEVYSGGKGDLSHMDYDDFDERISNMFVRLSEVIKYSNYDNHKFYPVIFTVGTHRRGTSGVRDMEYIFNQHAFANGFVLHDKLITVNRSPGSAFTFRRNHELGFLTKSHETTLIYLLYK